jgi:hypothetical protein
MNSERSTSPGAVIDFLRREAPFEFERLQSIGRLEASRTDGSGLPTDEGGPGPDPGDPAYAAWLRETFWIPREVALPLRTLAECLPS